MRKEAKNSGEYVPYAFMAYWAMPHCLTKYSPHYLVGTRLPIEDDWKPRVSDKELRDNDYEEYVKLLAKQMYGATKIAS